MNIIPRVIWALICEGLTYADRCSLRLVCKFLSRLPIKNHVSYWIRRNDPIISKINSDNLLPLLYSYGSVPQIMKRNFHIDYAIHLFHSIKHSNVEVFNYFYSPLLYLRFTAFKIALKKSCDEILSVFMRDYGMQDYCLPSALCSNRYIAEASKKLNNMKDVYRAVGKYDRTDLYPVNKIPYKYIPHCLSGAISKNRTALVKKLIMALLSFKLFRN